MSEEVIEVEAMQDTPYAFGQACTWHGDPRTAARAARADWPNDQIEPALACPVCGGPVIEAFSAEAWWYSARMNNAKVPDYEAMMRWSEGKCFPDFDTLQNSYRQAMEGTT